jgi:hypothetical protein
VEERFMKIRAATGGLIFILILAAAGTDVAGPKGSAMVKSIRKPANTSARPIRRHWRATYSPSYLLMPDTFIPGM